MANDKYVLTEERMFGIFVRPGDAVEVRGHGFHGNSKAYIGCAGGKGIIAGYFDDFAAFCTAVKALGAMEQGNIYFTLHAIDPRLIGRACNRLIVADKTTSDNDVLFYRWFPIDLDPVRPSGISSSDKELQAALDMREPVIEYCQKTFGFTSRPITAMSGNGGHILFRIPDTLATEAVKKKIEKMLKQLAAEFKNDVVEIDQTVFNPARIWTLYGTTKRKGDIVTATPTREARPHRISYIDSLGDYLEASDGKI
jgi:hypothetical protein